MKSGPLFKIHQVTGSGRVKKLEDVCQKSAAIPFSIQTMIMRFWFISIGSAVTL